MIRLPYAGVDGPIRVLVALEGVLAKLTYVSAAIGTTLHFVFVFFHRILQSKLFPFLNIFPKVTSTAYKALIHSITIYFFLDPAQPSLSVSPHETISPLPRV